MSLYESAQALIGDTPMVKLSNMGMPSGINIYAKLELWNPAGSVKDRIGKYMVEDAMARGVLKPGYTIVEATAGNTGLGVAFAALGYGFPTIFVVPDKFSVEKQTLMRALGATIVNTPEEGGMMGAAKKAEELRDEIKTAVSLEQFFNPANPMAHYLTTGPEIYRDLEGRIDYFVAGAGSGGTFTGVMRYLKEQNPNIKGVLADPEGSTLGGGVHGQYDIEGIGNDFVPETMDLSLVDRVIKVLDTDAYEQARKIARKEGIFAGSSSGAIMSAAGQLAADIAEEGNSANIAILFPDRGDRYFSKNLYE
jgi:cysteine synthase A